MRNKFFYPQHRFDTVRRVTPEFLLGIGKKYVIFDLDNTVAPYEEELPTEAVLEYFRALSDAGIRFALLSNNKPARVEKYTAGTGWLCYGKARKPFPKGIKKCMKSLSAEKESTLFIGDQLLTDCAAAHLAGIDFLLVDPINDKKTLFFRFKRRIERILLRNYGE